MRFGNTRDLVVGRDMAWKAYIAGSLLSKTVLTDVMKHRFLLLSTESARSPRIKSIWFGFGGFVEVWRYRAGSPVPFKFRDLAFLVDKGLEYAAKEVEMAKGTEKGGEMAL